jgi:hypothetical protein
VERLSEAAAEASKELMRLKSVETLAKRRSKEAHTKVSAAKKKLDKLRQTGRPGGSAELANPEGVDVLLEGNSCARSLRECRAESAARMFLPVKRTTSSGNSRRVCTGC